MTEAFVLARRGWPLTGAVPSQPHAAWLPAGARSVPSAMPPRVTVLPALDEAAPLPDENESEWWDATASRGSLSARDVVAARHANTRNLPEATERPPLQEAAGAAPPAASPVDREAAAGSALEATTATAQPQPVPLEPWPPTPAGLARQGVVQEHAALSAPRRLHTEPDPQAASKSPAITSAAPALEAVPQRDVSPARQPVSISSETPGHRDTAGQRLAAVTVSAATPVIEASMTMSLASKEITAGTPQSSQPVHALRSASPTSRITPPAARVQRHVEAAPPLMGLPAAPTVPSATAPAAASTAAPDLGALLAPAPAPQPRSVSIDRVSVTVHAPPMPAPPAAVRAAPASNAPRSASPSTFRNPWASYHLRRD